MGFRAEPVAAAWSQHSASTRCGIRRKSVRGGAAPYRPDMAYTVYILANGRHTTFYTGVTNDLARRMAEHRDAGAETFVGTYNVKTLVYAEQHADVRDAIVREKRLKRWRREWKLDLIRQQNPAMRDLWLEGEKPW